MPTYNEPVEVVQPTLESLAQIDYPHLVVQVVDNNTTDPALWKPIEELCARLGPRFLFVHLENWPGFKAGALNEATPRLPEEVEILGIVDADYQVHPQWLRNTIGYFDDPSVAFMQTSQHYREWRDNPYLRGLFYSFRYFFDITLIARSHRNAIIFCGTMGLIRRSAFNQIGGWNEQCITEDAEASLRMLGAGYRGVYDAAAYGEGLMPLDFDGLEKKQRFRWALGGIQILKLHWREMVPFARHRMRLSVAQRIHYLLGSVQWFAEVLTATFTVLLLATALATSLHEKPPGSASSPVRSSRCRSRLRARVCCARSGRCGVRAERARETPFTHCACGLRCPGWSRSRACAASCKSTLTSSHCQEQGGPLTPQRAPCVTRGEPSDGRRRRGRAAMLCARRASQPACWPRCSF